MGSLMKKQAERFLREKKRHRRWLAVFLSLSLLVTSGTFAALRMNGHAMDHTDKVLNCRLRIHEHTEECFDSHGELTCGKADYVLHIHNGKCIDENGNLVCKLPERKAHVHDSSCYTEERILTCQQEETAGHQHSEACYIEENGDLLCTLPEHQHSEGCYGEDGSLICGQEEHQHGEECFAKNQVLTCTEPESSGHTHSDSCYEVKKTLTCGQEEEIPHTHSEDCYDENGNLTCGLLELEEHEHGPGCFDDEEKPEEVKEEKENQPEDEPDGSVSGGETFANESPKEEHPKDEENNSEKPEETKAPEQKPTADDSKPEETVSGGSVSDDTVSENTASENAVSDNTLSGNSVSSDSLSGNTLSSNNVSDNSLSGNGVSGNSVSENTISLSANVGGTTITLSGPESSFEKGKELSIQAEEIISFKKANEQAAQAEENEEIKDDEQIETTEKVEEAKDSKQTETDKKAKDDEKAEADETDEKTEENKQIEAIDEAVKKLAEEKEKEVKDYQAFDIKLLADGEEVQPLGPVEVKFSGKKVEKAVENEKTDVEVLHVGEDTGKSQDTKTTAAEEKKVEIETEGYLAQDMKATATEEKEVVIETDHFSVYVYVNLGTNILGKINVTVQHWGENVETISGNADASKGTDTVLMQYPDTEKDENGFPKAEIQKKYENCELYSTDTLTIPNEYYADITALSKVCNVKPESAKNYTVAKVWVSKEGFDSSKAEDEVWPEGSYTEFTAEDVLSSNETPTETPEEITISEPSFIRFWYAPKDKDKNYDVTFYDYDITDGNWHSEEQGINSPENYINADGTQSDKKDDRLGVGQASAGNLSSWAATATLQKDKAVDEGRTLNKYTASSSEPNKLVTQEIVQPNLDDNGELQFNVTAPKNLFSIDGTGTTQYDNYKLGFSQKGDTYTLDYVLDTETSLNVESNLSKMTFMKPKWVPDSWTGPKPNIFSNNFWPLDNVPEKDPNNPESVGRLDPLMGNRINGEKSKYPFLYNDGTKKEIGIDNDDQEKYSGTITTGHNYYFGMRYSVDFTVGDYTGPMEYYFRGDDDFWLFIDGKLVVDIGGVHQVASESVDLRAKMEELEILTYDEDGNLENKNEPHTMQIFYMERGATGSCCYMQFTLPNSDPVPIPEPETTEYEVTKNWSDNNNMFRPNKIQVRLLQILGNNSNPTNIVVDLEKDKNWTYKWTGLPKINGSSKGQYEYKYSVEEITLPEGYRSVVDENGQLTNILDPVKVKVKKEWANDTGAEEYRPDQVTFRLYANGEPYQDQNGHCKEITLNENGNWEGEFANLPEYSYEYVYHNEEGETTPEEGDLTNSDETVDNSNIEADNSNRFEENENLEGEPSGDDWNSGDDEAAEAEPDGESGDVGADYEIKATKIQYTVKEVINGEVVEEGATLPGKDDSSYTVTYKADNYEAKDENDCVATITATNTLRASFKIVKRGGTAEPVNLGGAKFSLQSCDPDTYEISGEAVYTGLSAETTGVVKWTDSEGKEISVIAEGTYILQETEAPAGYALSEEKWFLNVDSQGKATISKIEKIDGEETLTPINGEKGSTKDEGVVFTYKFNNNILYELPSTGGTGIYWYMIGGMFLMMGASLILYRNRSKKAVRGC